MESSDESSSEEDRVNQYVFKQESENETSKDASELKEETQSGAEMKQEAKPRSDSKMEEKKPDGRPEVVTDEQVRIFNEFLDLNLDYSWKKAKRKNRPKKKRKKLHCIDCLLMLMDGIGCCCFLGLLGLDCPGVWFLL